MKEPSTTGVNFERVKVLKKLTFKRLGIWEIATFSVDRVFACISLRYDLNNKL